MNSNVQLEQKDERRMQGKERHKKVSSELRKASRAGKIPVIHTRRGGRHSKKAPTTGRVSGNGFLKKYFESLPIYKVGYGLTFSNREKELLTDETADYLVRTANNCLQLLGVDKQIISSGELNQDCYVIGKTLKEYLPADVVLDFDFREEQFSIILQSPYKGSFPDYTLFFFPISGIDKMVEPLATTFKKFVSYLCRTQGISFPYAHWDFSAVLQDWEPIDEDEEEYINDEVVDIIIDYREGHIHDIMQEINGMKVTKEDLLNELAQVNLVESYDLKLVNAMIEGVNLLSRDCIMNYECLERLEFRRLFCLVWKDDQLSDMVIDNINVDLQEVGDTSPCIWSQVTPESKELIKATTYPTDFSAWWMKIFEILEQYE